MVKLIVLVIVAVFFSNASLAQISRFSQDSNNPAADESDFDIEQNAINDLNSQKPIYDPLEKLNRKIYAFNDAFDRYLLRPVTRVYHKAPEPARASVGNFLTNLLMPISIFNSLLQGKVDNTLATTSNFLINSTVGIFGLFNIAGRKGIYYNREDFGQTLGRYKVSDGPYLVLPFFGPSTLRDLGGMGVDGAINPIDFNLLKIGGRTDLISWETRSSIAAARAIATRDNLIDTIDAVKESSFDSYATFRSAYTQLRSQQVKN